MEIIITLLIIILLPILVSNDKTFPYVLILGFTNILQFTYGINNYLLFSFGGKATGNIFLIYYYSVILIILIWQKIKTINLKIYYDKLFLIFGLLVLTGILASINFGFYFQSLARVMRGFLIYLNFVYLALYLIKNEKNVLNFVKALYSICVISFFIMIYEIINQKRLVIDAIKPDKLFAESYYHSDIFIPIVGVGEIFYSWARNIEFIPATLFLSSYFYLKDIKIKPFNNLIIFLFGLASLVLSLSRLAMIAAGIILIIFILTNLKLRITNIRKLLFFSFTLIALISIILIIENTLYLIIYNRFLMAEELYYGEGTAVSRLVTLEFQLKNLSESLLFGKGFSFKETGLVIDADLGISNLLPIFGILGLVFPIYVIITTFKILRRIGHFDFIFFNSFLVIFITYFIFYPIFQDYYLSNPVFIVPLLAIINNKYYNKNFLDKISFNKI